MLRTEFEQFFSSIGWRVLMVQSDARKLEQIASRIHHTLALKVLKVSALADMLHTLHYA